MGYPIAMNHASGLNLTADSGRIAGTGGRWGVIPDWVWSAQGRPGSGVSPLRLARVLEDVGDRLNIQQIRSRLMQDSSELAGETPDGGSKGA